MARGRHEAKKDPIKFSKRIVVLVLISVLVFTVTMIFVFLRTGAVPDTLVTAFFAFAGGEAGVLGLLRHSENKYSSPPQKPADENTDEPVG